MFKKKKRTATTDDLPTSELPIDTTLETIPWDPAGTNTVPETPAENRTAHVLDGHAQPATPPAVDDPDLQQFLQAISDAKDAESTLVAIAPEAP